MSDLEAAYRATTYEVGLPSGQAEIRIGHGHPDLDGFMVRHLDPSLPRHWVHITAWNPGSRPLSREENIARNHALRERLDAMRSRGRCGHWCRGLGRSVDGSWEEEAFWVPGIALHEAMDLGRAFGQNAMVAGLVGERARLVWLYDGL